jgi:hypothetical protein
VVVVVPQGVMRRRHFSAGAIALALLRFGLGVRVVDIRKALGGQGETAAWPSLRRWARAARAGQMWKAVRDSPAYWGLRAVAERVAMTLAAFAPAGLAYARIDDRVFAGAAHAA